MASGIESAGTEVGKLVQVEFSYVCSVWELLNTNRKDSRAAHRTLAIWLLASNKSKRSIRDSHYHIIPIPGQPQHVRHSSRTVRNLPGLGKFNINSRGPRRSPRERRLR